MKERHKKIEEPPVVKNVQAIAELERRLFEERKHINRLSNIATNIAGSPSFIVAHLALFAGWVFINTTNGKLSQIFEKWVGQKLPPLPTF